MSEALFRLAPQARAALERLVPTVCPMEAGQEGLARLVVDDLEEFMRSMPALFQQAIPLGVLLFDAAASLHPANAGKRFAELDDKRAQAWFDLWWHSPVVLLGEFARKIKALVAMVYYERPEVKAALGYTPEAWIEKVKVRREQKYAEEIRQEEEAVLSPKPLLASLEQARRAEPSRLRWVWLREAQPSSVRAAAHEEVQP